MTYKEDLRKAAKKEEKLRLAVTKITKDYNFLTISDFKERYGSYDVGAMIELYFKQFSILSTLIQKAKEKGLTDDDVFHLTRDGDKCNCSDIRDKLSYFATKEESHEK